LSLGGILVLVSLGQGPPIGTRRRGAAGPAARSSGGRQM